MDVVLKCLVIVRQWLKLDFCTFTSDLLLFGHHLTCLQHRPSNCCCLIWCC